MRERRAHHARRGDRRPVVAEAHDPRRGQLPEVDQALAGPSAGGGGHHLDARGGAARRGEDGRGAGGLVQRPVGVGHGTHRREPAACRRPGPGRDALRRPARLPQVRVQIAERRSGHQPGTVHAPRIGRQGRRVDEHAVGDAQVAHGIGTGGRIDDVRAREEQRDRGIGDGPEPHWHRLSQRRPGAPTAPCAPAPRWRPAAQSGCAARWPARRSAPPPRWWGRGGGSVRPDGRAPSART